MVQIKPQHVNVAIQHLEPLLARGVHSALTGAPGIQIVEAGGARPGERVHVVVTDWAQAERLLLAPRGPWSCAPCVLVIAAQVRQQPLVSAMRRGLGWCWPRATSPNWWPRCMRSLAATATSVPRWRNASPPTSPASR